MDTGGGKRFHQLCFRPKGEAPLVWCFSFFVWTQDTLLTEVLLLGTHNKLFLYYVPKPTGMLVFEEPLCPFVSR